MTTTPAMIKAALEGRNVDATPEGIMRSERAGQQALVASTHMPKEMRPNREAFEKIGFVFGKDVDDIFIEATMPPGWKRAATEHAMHSDILDEQGRKRVGVFYKAAFYDRRANAGLICRYRIRWMYPDEPGSDLKEGEIRYVVTDVDTVIHRLPAHDRRDWAADKERKAEADKWLEENHPGADDPTAYW